MTEVTTGATVRIHYTGTLEDGTVFDSSEGRDPLEFTVGSGMIIPGLDKALPGMSVGEQKKVTIAPEEAYGPRQDEALLEVPRKDIPAEIPLEVGLQLQMSGPQGQPMPVTVAELTDDSVTLDANHALAGQTLIFDFEIVSIG
ncbi:FKBP-type peptidyl-prolyl cis-trans isomerase [Aliiroseovarius sp. CAU 1755]